MHFNLGECFRHDLLVSFTYNCGSKYSFSHFSTLNQTYTLSNYARSRCPGFKYLLRYQHAKGSTGISGQKKKTVLVDSTILLHYSGQIWSHSNQICHHLLLKFCTINYLVVHKENLWCYGFKDVFSTITKTVFKWSCKDKLPQDTPSAWTCWRRTGLSLIAL